MAQLVKFNAYPHKYFAERCEHFWPLNQIINYENYKRKNNFQAQNKDYREQISSAFLAYLSKGPHELANASMRGAKLKRQRNVADIIILAALWHENITDEIKSLSKLSHVIAENIINNNIPKKSLEKISFYLQDKLKDFFYLEIYLSQDTFCNLNKLDNISYFITKGEAMLKIFLNDEEHQINLSGLDMRRVISRVMAFLKRDNYAMKPLNYLNR